MATDKTATQCGIAERLGISQITVSRVLNGSELVSEKTRQRVMEEVERCGYSLNLSARNLVSGRSGIIGIVLPGLKTMNSFYFLPTFQGINSEASDRHYSLQVINVQDEGAVLASRADGFIVFDIGFDESTAAMRKILAGFRKKNVQHVLVRSRQGKCQSSYVTIDNVVGGRKAAEHLLSLGHKNVAYVCIGSGGSEGQDRWKGFSSVIEKNGGSAVQENIPDCYEEEIAAVVDKFTNPKSGRRITGVFTYSDHVARLIELECRRVGKSVPGDLSIVGFDDRVAYTEMSRPYLTTIRQPLIEVGRQAARRILCAEQKDSLKPCIVEPQLVVRDSSREAPVGL